MKTIPTINFNGSFLVNSLELGWIQILSRQFFAVRIMFHQTLNYPVLAYESLAADIYAYCFDARQSGRSKLEAYAPCYLLKDQQSGSMTPVIASITWYTPPILHKRDAEQVTAILTAENREDQPPFAAFAESDWE
jgi:hypothetical protein